MANAKNNESRASFKARKKNQEEIITVVNAKNNEFQAFLRACKKNGLPVLPRPNPYNQRGPVIIGDDGEKYTITPEMEKQPCSKQDTNNRAYV